MPCPHRHATWADRASRVPSRFMDSSAEERQERTVHGGQPCQRCLLVCDEARAYDGLALNRMGRSGITTTQAPLKASRNI
ncbi:protein of unknown function (plasmid) [Paraburkholderia dioscoreae]|uniref:Uncharacterized protein n=1 Tax=Paraburkholderia dioscoreae TaxID=2604047 RepID=A0A5Q4ZL21_9BURK|nr:protein of unknown function [Paraburkholderia dioscoreae]